MRPYLNTAYQRIRYCIGGADFSVYKDQLGDDPYKWVGQVFSDEGYMSTTVNVNKKFGGVHAEIRAPKGTNGGYLGNLPDGTHNNEAEWLLPRGSSMVVTGVEFHPGTHIVTKIYTEVVDN